MYNMKPLASICLLAPITVALLLVPQLFLVSPCAAVLPVETAENAITDQPEAAAELSELVLSPGLTPFELELIKPSRLTEPDTSTQLGRQKAEKTESSATKSVEYDNEKYEYSVEDDPEVKGKSEVEHDSEDEDPDDFTSLISEGTEKMSITVTDHALNDDTFDPNLDRIAPEKIGSALQAERHFNMRQGRGSRRGHRRM